MKRTWWLAVLVAGCTNSLRYNEGYVAHLEDRPKIAVVPILIETTGVADAVFEGALEGLHRQCSIVPIHPLREHLMSDSALRSLLVSIAEKGRSPDSDLRHAPTIADVAGKDSLARLRSSMDDADVLLFPISFSTKTSLGHLFGWMTIRLYDLRDGRLIFEDDRDLNADKDDENARRVLLLYFAAFAAKDIDETYLGAR